MIKIGTLCTGIGSPEVAIENLGVEHEITFACEIDKFARASYLSKFKPNAMYEDMTKEAWDKPEQYADLVIAGIPCQAFSLAGKRLGELDPRGLLFFDFYRYVKNQQPKVFIIENVKGLLSDASGNTFQNWLLLLGNSVNGNMQMFGHEDSLEYNLHWTVLNSKDFGVPQNRERVFIVGIRKDLPNDFKFPAGWRLEKRLKDVLENHVDEKYYLSEKLLKWIFSHREKRGSSGNNFFDGSEQYIGCVTARYHKTGAEDNYIKVSEATRKGYSEAKEGDSINLSNPKSKTRRGRVGSQIANTLDTSCNQAVVEPIPCAMRGRYEKGGIVQKLEFNGNETTNTITGVQKDNLVLEPCIYQVGRGYNDGGIHDHCPPITCNSFQHNNFVMQLNTSKESGGKQPYQQNRVYDSNGISTTIDTGAGRWSITDGFRIRRLTPLECWRLQSFPDEYFYKAKNNSIIFTENKITANIKDLNADKHKTTKGMSETQLYKQAGNSITVSVMQSIIKNMLHLLK